MRTRVPAIILSGLLVLGVAACDSSTEADGQVESDPGTTTDGLGADTDGTVDGSVDGSLDGSTDGSVDDQLTPTE